ncbi:MAG: hypothetical protein KIS90_14275, partial [Phenylobacterium sp.]|nr:hypothetical protein [Phenylobacterium sp.]
LEPVVVDQCLRLSLGPLPPTQVCLPNRQRLGLTLFGVEVFGLTLEGEARILLSDLPRPPHIVQVSAPAPHRPREDCDGGESHAAEAATAPQGGQPFVVRLGR